VLQALAAWRETLAQSSDRPRRWILKDEILFDMARHLPDSRDKLARIRGLEKGVLERYGQLWLEMIQTARALPKEQWPKLELAPRLNTEQEALVDAMMALLRLRSAQHKVSPATLGGRRELERLMLGDATGAMSHGWRAALVGGELQSLLRGELTLRVADGRLIAESV